MSNETSDSNLPMSGGGSAKQPSPGATDSQSADSSNQPAGNLPKPNCGSPATESPGATESLGASDSKDNQQNAQRTSDQPDESSHGQRFASLGALLSAFIASSGCWLPPLLILGGISGAGMTTFMEQYRPVFMVVTFVFLGAAFYQAYRPRPNSSDHSRSTIMKLNRIMLWAVAVVAIVFLFFPQAVTGLYASGDVVTADMQRTVITIEGMTGHTGTPKAEQAIKTAPGVLAVTVDYETKQATIGTEKGKEVPTQQILATLESIGYTGEVVTIQKEGPLPPSNAYQHSSSLDRVLLRRCVGRSASNRIMRLSKNLWIGR